MISGFAGNFSEDARKKTKQGRKLREKTTHFPKKKTKTPGGLSITEGTKIVFGPEVRMVEQGE